MSVDLVIHDIALVADGRASEDVGTPAGGHAWIAVDAGRVVATGVGDDWRAQAPRTSIDGACDILSPGFVDIHGHGGGGFAYDDGAEAIAAARALHRRHGTTRAVLSLVTAPIDDLVVRLGAVADAMTTDATVLGAHLEGPFLSSDYKGAHDPALLRAPDARTVDRLLEAGRDTIRQVTLAPELPGAEDAVARFVAAGVAVAVGHTAADADAVTRAFDAGATILTHAFNAMRGIHHRAPGPVAAAMRDERVVLELIADGVHVHPDVLRLAFAGAPGRIALVTDAMAAAGAADGRYELGGLSVDVRGGIARLAQPDDAVGEGSIAGSTLTQDAALRLVTDRSDVPLVDAIDALTRVPARAVGAEAGSLAVGATADAVLLDRATLGVRGVWVAGSAVRDPARNDPA